MPNCKLCNASHSCLCGMAMALDGSYTCKGCLTNYNQSLAPKKIESVEQNVVDNSGPYQVPAPIINSITHFNNY